MQPIDKGPRRKDTRRAMNAPRDRRPERPARKVPTLHVVTERAADGGPMLAAGDMTPAESARYSQDYSGGYRQGRSDYVRGAYAVPESASDGYRDGYARGYHWTRMHGMPSVALVAS